LWLGGEAGRSALAGGGIGFAGRLTYALVAFWSGTRDPEAALRAQVAAEAGKLVLTVALFVLVFVFYRTLAALPFFAGLMVTLVIPYLVVLLKKS
jgi:ATP synthase protein I